MLVGDLAGKKPRVVHLTGGQAVRVLATRDHGVTRLLVLNTRTGQGRYRPALHLPGVTGSQCVEIRRLSGGLTAKDTPVVSTGLPATAHLGGATWKAGATYRPSFPDHSVTGLTVSPKNGAPCTTPTQW
jgi:hypothetical protein